MPETPLDWEKVELLRERMGLTVTELCRLFEVTRATYYAWVAGGPIRGKNDRRVRDVLRQLIVLVKSGQWPPSGVKSWPSEKRYSRLLEILETGE